MCGAWSPGMRTSSLRPLPGSHECRLTPRSRRGPTARHQAREAERHIIFLAGLAPCRRSRLTSNVSRSMAYDHRPVTDLLRGPLLHTPQGWVVVATTVFYAGLALAGAYFGVSPSLAKSPSAFFVVCVAWPMITFLFFVRSSSPNFGASKTRSRI
jgi:hypothetical protein